MDGTETQTATWYSLLSWDSNYVSICTCLLIWEKKTLMLFQTVCLLFPRHQTTVKNIVHACKACRQIRPGKGQHAGLRYRGEGPGQHWEIDFTEPR